MTTEPIIEGSVRISRDAGIGTLEFFHPAANSLPGALLAQLVSGVEELGTDPEVRVIILKSHGVRTFCAGASFSELASISDIESGHRFFMGFAHVINAMRKCPKIIIGMVQGKTVGGGVGLAAATDYCLGTRSACIRLSELAIGIGPFVVGPAVERRLGKAAYAQLAINAKEWFRAEWALDKGFYASLYEDYENLEDGAYLLAKELSAYSPEAMKRLKEVLWADATDWDELLHSRARISGELVLTDFAQQTISDIRNKKK